MAERHRWQDLQEQLARGQFVLFVGADLPRDVTGLPSRADLARDLARHEGLDESLSLAEVTQRVSRAGSRWTFTAFIRDVLDRTRVSQPFHRRIAALVQEHRIGTLITTAYDNLLELAFQEAGVAFNRVVRGSDVSFIDPDRPTLIKLYGDAQQPDTLVVTDRDHSDLLRDREREAVIDEVRQAFRRNTVLFLGYNLSDPDFRFLFDQIAESRFARTAYAVWPGLPEADVQMWRDRGIVILDTDPVGAFEVQTVPEKSMAEVRASQSVGDAPWMPGEFVLMGNWQVLQGILDDCVNAFRSDEGSRFQLTYAGVNPASANDDDWFVSVEATYSYRGRSRTGKVGQVEALALEGDWVLVRLVPVDPFASVAARFFARIIKEANARGLVEEEKASLASPPSEDQPTLVSVGGPSYCDLEILVGDRHQDGYPIHVIASPAGEGEGTFNLPFSENELGEALTRMERGDVDEAFLVDYGTRLFRALFSADVMTRYAESVGLTGGSAGLRIRLRIDPPELRSLPWELLYDPEKREFLVLSKRALVTRYLHVPRPTSPLEVELPLRVLVAAAAPQDLPPLSMDAEIADIRQALRPLVDKGMVRLTVEPHATKHGLRRCLMDVNPHVLHYVGHGGLAEGGGALFLEDGEGRADPLDGPTLGVLLKGGQVRLAVLNACLSGRDVAPEANAFAPRRAAYLGVGPALVDAGLGAVVAMQFSLTEASARAFAEDFYAMLAFLKPVDECVSRAREALLLGTGLGGINWATPVLFMRAPDGRLFAGPGVKA